MKKKKQEKQVTLISKKIDPIIDKDSGIIYIRGVDKQMVSKFDDYAGRLNMNRSRLFEILVRDCLK